MISYSICPISIVFCTLKNPQNDTKIIILPLLVKKLWNGLKRMAAILFLCKWCQKVLVGHASMSEMICMTINYYHAKLNNSTQKCRVQYILDRLHGPLRYLRVYMVIDLYYSSAGSLWLIKTQRKYLQLKMNYQKPIFGCVGFTFCR